MSFTKSLSYKLKTALPALALAGGAMMASCEKEEPETPVTPTIDVEVKISDTDKYSLATDPYASKITPSEIITNYINNPQIRTIYIVPITNGGWGIYNKDYIPILREKFLMPILNLSPKVRGKGDFNFKPGEASKVSNDSLWFVQNGWTINKDLQKQE